MISHPHNSVKLRMADQCPLKVSEVPIGEAVEREWDQVLEKQRQEELEIKGQKAES
ncbi:hypothetical protein V5O48_015300 [Marasmius crinis-equi]|uniref:Uncharacterized protein n=1 Tax=Marasmius crinis-equi TaxID=585013 RepID=A0ABR3EUX1_9AGAR